MEVCTEAIKTLHTWNTGYSADSVEWCPIENYRNIFVCGTYQLAEKDGGMSDTSSAERLGKIFLFLFEKGMTELSPMQTIETAAVLDQKWCQHLINGKPHLGVVNASGFLQIYSLSDEESIITLILMTEVRVNEEVDNLALSLDWSNNKYANNPLVAVSDSKGKISVHDFDQDNNLNVAESWSGHDYEAWICAFDSWNPSIILTGGDDSKLKVFDRRCTQRAQHTIKLDAGATSLHSNIEREHIIASGGYDQFTRIWDTRKMKQNLTEVDCGGGVWRLKWEPAKHEMLLAACMYDGFKLLDYQNSSLNIVAKYDHESIAYGADWCYDTSILNDGNNSMSNLMSTCSFYNCKLTVAEINISN